jgi:hypothetical protein
LDIPSPLKARTVLTFGAIPSFRPSDIASPLSRLRAVTRSPHYALLYNAGPLISHTSDYQLPAGCGLSQSLLVVPSASSELALYSAEVNATSRRPRASSWLPVTAICN